mmetsp:Transcript_10336/g.19844  ORF Transcript_10336/g.19844 Transcript_10336/m.19844 type:complete len:91 (-) Transcript_10336:115-387(-)|eukprot:scaffold2155_cov162-Amphora_coffeaeformis.AAC.5
MGCSSSKSFVQVDDSIHVLLSKNNVKGESAYVPRKPHPLLVSQRLSPTVVESDSESTDEIYCLLYHASHRNDSIDPRDLAEYGNADRESS